jgi:hypothetical protein
MRELWGICSPEPAEHQVCSPKHSLASHLSIVKLKGGELFCEAHKLFFLYEGRGPTSEPNPKKLWMFSQSIQGVENHVHQKDLLNVVMLG